MLTTFYKIKLANQTFFKSQMKTWTRHINFMLLSQTLWCSVYTHARLKQFRNKYLKKTRVLSLVIFLMQSQNFSYSLLQEDDWFDYFHLITFFVILYSVIVYNIIILWMFRECLVSNFFFEQKYLYLMEIMSNKFMRKYHGFALYNLILWDTKCRLLITVGCIGL